MTGQSGDSYIFASDEVFERIIAKERAEAAYEARLMEAVGHGIADIEIGNYYTDIDEAFDKAENLRKKYA